MNKKNILIINAALNGSTGNTAQLLKIAERKLRQSFEVDTVCLNNRITFDKCISKIKNASGFIIGTGVHWNGWSSLLQKFLESATPTEGKEMWLGKPCGFIVTMHSVGGIEVLSRLITTMNLMGCFTPPACGMSYSLAEHKSRKSKFNENIFWDSSDINIVCHNLSEAINHSNSWKFWKVDRSHINDVWLK
ncbi:MAG: NAD(P)H-dependent oxidoreductase [Nanoarchaeota archaeon]